MLFETRIEFIIIANIILLPVNTTWPPLPGQGNGGHKHEALSTPVQVVLMLLSALILIIDANSLLPIQAKVSAVVHMGNILFFVM